MPPIYLHVNVFLFFLISVYINFYLLYSAVGRVIKENAVFHYITRSINMVDIITLRIPLKPRVNNTRFKDEV